MNHTIQLKQLHLIIWNISFFICFVISILIFCFFFRKQMLQTAKPNKYHYALVFRSLHDYTDTRWMTRWERERKLQYPLDWNNLPASKLQHPDPQRGLIFKGDKTSNYLLHAINNFEDLVL